MIRRPPRSTQSRSSAASDVYKRQDVSRLINLRSWMFSSFVAEPDRTGLEDLNAVGLMLFIQIDGHLIHWGYQGIFAHKPINAAKLKPKKLSDCSSGDDR